MLDLNQMALFVDMTLQCLLATGSPATILPSPPTARPENTFMTHNQNALPKLKAAALCHPCAGRSGAGR